MIYALLIVPFLPYLPYGLRVEHIFATIFSLLLLHYGWTRKPLYRFVLIPTAGLAVGVIVTVVSSALFNTAGEEAGIVNMLGRLTLAPLLMLSLYLIIYRENLDLPRLIGALIVTSAIIGCISVLSIIPPIAYILHPFVIEGGVWTASRDIGRHPGIFNQPLEAGLFFGLAAIIFVFASGDAKRNPIVIAALLTICLIAGSVSLSKTFVLGVGLAIIYSLWTKRWVSLLVLCSTAVWITLSSMILNPSGSYFRSLLDLFNAGGPIAAVSAGRFGIEEAGNSEMTVELASSDWGNVLLGFGLGSKMPLDSGFLEYAYQGGIIALAGYLFFFAFFFWISLRYLTGEARLLGIFVVAFSLLASVGGPTLTANRAGYILILILSALLVTAYRTRLTNAFETPDFVPTSANS